MAIPRPGQPVRGSQSGAPIKAAFEFISPSILNSRLKDLREAKLIDRSLEGYRLTPLGEELFNRPKPLGDWSIRWAEHVSSQQTKHWRKYRKKLINS